MLSIAVAGRQCLYFARVLSAIKHAFEQAVLSQSRRFGLTCGPPALCFLLHFIAILAIERLGMGLCSRHAANGERMEPRKNVHRIRVVCVQVNYLLR